MATKSKGNEKKLENHKEGKKSKAKHIITLITFLLVITTYICLLLTYPLIEKNAKERTENFSFFKNSNLRQEIIDTNYGLYYNYLENKAKKDKSDIEPYKDLIISRKENRYSSEFEKEHNLEEDRKEINYYIKNLINRVNSLGNLKVYAVDGKGNTVYKSEGDQSFLLESLVKNKDYRDDDLERYYMFYIILKYNDKGEASIEKIYGEDKEMEQSLLLDIRNNDFLYNSNEYEIKPIENMTYVYGVPRNLKYRDNLYFNYINYKDNALKASSIPFIMIGVMFILLTSLIIPFKYEKEILGFSKLSKIPLEINFLISQIILAFTLENESFIIGQKIQERLIDIFKFTKIPNLDAISSIVSFTYLVVIFGFIFFYMVYLKYLFNIGIKNCIKNHTLIYKFKEVLICFLKRIAKFLKKIDLSKGINKYLLIILGANFVIVSIFCIFGVFGIFLSLIYSVVLFYFGRKYIDKIKKDYKNILEKTEEISKGNFEFKEDLDFGLFNELKGDLNNIQKGFKEAVLKEVKSQRMKTELISNVSHDLKTPLTSIIAYVDLLKREEDEDKRKSYLQTLDRKSQRLKYLIEDLFEVSKATTGDVKLNIMKIDISYLIRQVVLELDDKIKESKLDIRLTLPDNKVILSLDDQRTYRVFENLVINAVKYAMPNSRVYIELKEEAEKVYITIKNISAEEITFNAKEISERFVRGDKSRSTEGSGLGLAIVKSFVELQGGEFNIEVDGDLFKAIVIFNKK